MLEQHPLELDRLNYHRRREAEERQRSETATDPIVRRLHHDLAHRHADVIRNGLTPELQIARDL